MDGLLGLLPTSGENFKSTAPLEIYLLRKKMTCSIPILPAVYIYIYIYIYICICICVCVCVYIYTHTFFIFFSNVYTSNSG